MRCRGLFLLSFGLLLGVQTAQAQDVKLGLPIGHTERITDVQLSPDGRRIVTTSEDNSAKLWDSVTGNLIFTLLGHTEEIKQARFSPDSKMLITIPFNQSVTNIESPKIWDVLSGKVIADLIGHKGYVGAADFNPSGQKVVTISGDDTLRTWGVNGKIELAIGLPKDSYDHVEYSPKGEWIVASGAKAIFVHTKSAIVEVLEGAYQISFSPDGKYIAYQGKENKILVSDITTSPISQIAVLSDPDEATNTHGLYSPKFSPNGKYITAQSGKRTLLLWDAQTGKFLKKKEVDFDFNTFTQVLPNPNNRAKVVPTKRYYPIVWSELNPKWDFVTLLALWQYHPARLLSNGRIFVDNEGDPELWSANSGKKIMSLNNHANKIASAVIDPNRKAIAFHQNRNIKVWDMSKGLITSKFNPTQEYRASPMFPEIFNHDGTELAISNEYGDAQLWDLQTESLAYDLGSAYYGIKFGNNGKKLITFPSMSLAKIWDANSGKTMATIPIESVTSFEFSPDENMILTLGDTVKLWDANSGNLLRVLEDSLAYGRIYQFDHMGNIVTISTYLSGLVSVKLWDTQGNLLAHDDLFPLTDKIPPAPPYSTEKVRGALRRYLKKEGMRFTQVISENNQLAMTRDNDEKGIKIWALESGNLISELKFNAMILTATFTDDGKKFLTSSVDKTVKIWDTHNGSVIREFTGFDNPQRVRISDDGKKIATVSYFTMLSPSGEAFPMNSDKNIAIWETASGKKIFDLVGHAAEIDHFQFITNGQLVISSSKDGIIKTWDVNTGTQRANMLYEDLELKYEPRVDSQAINFISEGGSLVFYRANSQEALITLIPVGENDWIIFHPSGLFDATPNAMNLMYWLRGDEVIEFNQLKERYYEPGLWKKVMSGEKLRNVVGMKSIELPPDIRVGQVDEKGYLPIEVTNKGGGIGEVTVLINGKEAIADARPKGSDSKAKQLSLKVFVGNNKALVKGAENYIAVKAWNEGHWVVSRGAVVEYSTSGNDNAYKPAIHIITSGVSDYTGTELDLKYAAKDAEDVSKALQLGAKKLFGIDRSYVYNLTTSQPTNQYPTKANILKIFEKVSSVAHPLDVVVVYLSGHGINHGGQDGDWYYLTQDAYTSSSSAYNDPEIRRTSTVSSNELVELFKKVPALKQVLMIDACASGKVVENLMAKKDIESTTLRALDRMRDRTGLHIITGCTADAVSYEASKYGQGVLTYSLLEGIRGAALREDQFVDINKLFQYAHDRVPTLAEGIGGIQTPQVFSPQGGQSFDIGVLSDIEKKEIPIAKIRPVYIRSAFIDDDQLEDALQLGKKVDDALNEAASKGTGSSIIFVDVREYPEGCKLSGKYKQEGGIIKLKLRKKCEGKDETIEISGKTVEEVRGKILSSL